VTFPLTDVNFACSDGNTGNLDEAMLADGGVDYGSMSKDQRRERWR